MTERLVMRSPCRACGCEDGYVEPANGQRVVRCEACETYGYCQPLAEAGIAPTRVRSRDPISPSQRARIFERDGGICQVCHRADGMMHIGHLLSVADGRKLDVGDDLLFHDENLCIMCAECNLGQGSRSHSLRLVCRILEARVRWARVQEAGGEPAA